MRVLVACEWSGVVRDAFLRRGHDAYSCDIERAEHPNPNWRRHIRGDVRPLLRDRWDLVIAHPPCTYLCNSGVHLLGKEPGRYERMCEAVLFFKDCLDANAPMVCVENPIMHGEAAGFLRQRCTQTIQPWQFGHPESKATCLWLRGLPLLQPTDMLEKRKRWSNQTPTGRNKLGGKNRAHLRARTYAGKARAMAEQWG